MGGVGSHYICWIPVGHDYITELSTVVFGPYVSPF